MLNYYPHTHIPVCIAYVRHNRFGQPISHTQIIVASMCSGYVQAATFSVEMPLNALILPSAISPFFRYDMFAMNDIFACICCITYEYSDIHLTKITQIKWKHSTRFHFGFCCGDHAGLIHWTHSPTTVRLTRCQPKKLLSQFRRKSNWSAHAQRRSLSYYKRDCVNISPKWREYHFVWFF